MTPISQSLIESQKLSEKIETLLLESEGEVNEQLEQLLEFHMEQGEALKRQVDNVGLTIDRLDSLHDFYTKKILALNRVLSSLENAKDRLTMNVLESIQAQNLEAIRGHHFEMKIKKNHPSLELSPDVKLPEHFIEITMTEKVRKKEIINALKVGEEIPGARLIQKVRLTVGEVRPQIREVNND